MRAGGCCAWFSRLPPIQASYRSQSFAGVPVTHDPHEHGVFPAGVPHIHGVVDSWQAHYYAVARQGGLASIGRVHLQTFARKVLCVDQPRKAHLRLGGEIPIREACSSLSALHAPYSKSPPWTTWEPWL